MKNNKWKNKNIQTNKEIINKKYNLYYTYIILFLIIISFPIYNQNNLGKLINDSEIILTIKGKNIQPILNNHTYALYDKITGSNQHYTFDTKPSEILVNGKKIKEIDFYVNLNEEENNIAIKFNKKLKNCNVMFYGLSNITKIDFKNFDTSEVTSMIGMFYNCINLTSLDLTDINMFYDCSYLISLNLSNLNKLSFNTSSVTRMDYMFYGCRNLISLDLRNFDTSSVTNMDSMFGGCINLKSLDLSNFNTSSVTNMDSMFGSCNNLKSLNLSNFNTSGVTRMNDMFSSCYNLISLDLSNFNISSVKSMYQMFWLNRNLISLDLSNFNTTSVINMHSLFYGCNNLKSLDLRNFDTSSVINMQSMFYGCNNLISLDLSNFNTSSVESMEYMFRDCNNLISLNLSNFDTSSVTTMYFMFYNCNNLISLDLSNFDTSSVTKTAYMFYNCSNLILLDISNFNIPSVKTMDQMLWGCKKLISLDLSSFYTTLKPSVYNMFYGCNENLVICLNSSQSNFFFSKFQNLNNNNCSDICFYKNKKIIFDTKTCSLNCPDLYAYEYNNICYSSCPNGTHNITDNNICINNNYENLNLNPTNLIDLSDNISNNFYQDFKTDLEDTDNLYYECEYFYYYKDNKYNCTLNEECPEEYNKLIIDKKQCIDKCSNDYFYKFEYGDNCYINCPKGTTISKFNNHLCVNTSGLAFEEIFFNLCKIVENENEGQKLKDEDNFLNNIKKVFYNGKIDYLLSNVIKGEDLTVKTQKGIYIFTTTDNQNNNINNNYSLINLGECENILKNHYNISNNEPLLIFKIDVYIQGHLIPSIEYEVYKLLTKEKLNLTYCNKENIRISIPVNINEDNLFIYNPASEFYNDICFPYTTKNRTDICLKDRREEFNNNNLSLCEKDCEYEGYDSEAKRALCNCKIKIKLPLISEIELNKNKLLYKLNIKKSSNFKVIKCYKLFLTKNGILKNIGSYILLFIILSNIILLVLFYIKGYNKLYDIIKIIINNKKDNKKNENKIIKFDNNNNSHIHKKKASNNIAIQKKNENIKINIPINNRNIKTNGEEINSSNSKTSFKYNDDNSKKVIDSPISKQSNHNEQDIKNNIINFNDYELNTLLYDDAKKYDKRNYFKFYFSLLKINHAIIFTFFNNDYNSKLIKIYLFLFSFALYFTVNGLFFNDSTMHKIYKDGGEYDFIYQMPLAIYSSLICSVINSLIKNLSLYQKNVLEIKNWKDNETLEHKAIDILKCIKIKLILFFILSFIFNIFFWYFLGCFCIVYQNTQIHLIKDTIISFGLSFLYPFGIYLIPGIFRIPSLNKNKKRECLYKFSTIIQLI